MSILPEVTPAWIWGSHYTRQLPIYTVCRAFIHDGLPARGTEQQWGMVAEYRYNLEYFVKEAVQEDDGCQYIIVVQQVCYWRMASAVSALCDLLTRLQHYSLCISGPAFCALREQMNLRAAERFFFLENSSTRMLARMHPYASSDLLQRFGL